MKIISATANIGKTNISYICKRSPLFYNIILLQFPLLFFAQQPENIELTSLYKTGKLKVVHRDIKIATQDGVEYI